MYMLVNNIGSSVINISKLVCLAIKVIKEQCTDLMSTFVILYSSSSLFVQLVHHKTVLWYRWKILLLVP